MSVQQHIGLGGNHCLPVANCSCRPLCVLAMMTMALVWLHWYISYPSKGACSCGNLNLPQFACLIDLHHQFQLDKHQY